MKNKSNEFLIHILDGFFLKFNRYNHGNISQRISNIISFTKLRKESNIIHTCSIYLNDKN